MGDFSLHSFAFLRTIIEHTINILLFDTDKGNADILIENIYDNKVKSTWSSVGACSQSCEHVFLTKATMYGEISKQMGDARACTKATPRWFESSRIGCSKRNEQNESFANLL